MNPAGTVSRAAIPKLGADPNTTLVDVKTVEQVLSLNTQVLKTQSDFCV